MGTATDWRQMLPEEASLVFPLDEAGARIVAAKARLNNAGVLIASLSCYYEDGSVLYGVPLKALADGSHRHAGDGPSFRDDGRLRLYRWMLIDFNLSAEQTERVVAWAQAELSRLTRQEPRRRLSSLAV